MKEKQLKLLNYQLLTTIAFMISLLISIILTIDERQELLKKQRLFSEQFDKNLNLSNRIFALAIVSFILYINYSDYKIKGKKGVNTTPLKHQIYASILSVISALIVLYVVVENWYENPNINSIENPII